MAYVKCPQCNVGLGREPEFSESFDDADWAELQENWQRYINKHYCRHNICLNRACEECCRRGLDYEYP